MTLSYCCTIGSSFPLLAEDKKQTQFLEWHGGGGKKNLKKLGSV